MQYEQFRKEVEKDIRKMIREGDIVCYMQKEEVGELISVVPFEYEDRMRPYISLEELYLQFEAREEVSTEGVASFIVSRMAELWDYAIKNNINCAACSEAGDTSKTLLS